ncbi:MAG TPA: hypothetical protein VG757_04165 [Devosia sp.]|nr:hypothetical protein [Devosia sp.]
MVPRLLVRVRKALKRLPSAEPIDPDIEGPAITAEWQNMIARVAYKSRERERRLVSAERALNRLGLH